MCYCDEVVDVTLRAHPQPQATVAGIHEALRLLPDRLASSVRLIAVDGATGAGKSALARQLAIALDATAVDLDDYLVKGKEEFFGALRLDDLEVTLAPPSGVVVVSGVCNLRVLEALNLSADLLIYVKRMRKRGWADEEEVDLNALAKFAREQGKPIGTWPLALEVCEYHRDYRPVERADLIVERLDET